MAVEDVRAQYVNICSKTYVRSVCRFLVFRFFVIFKKGELECLARWMLADDGLKKRLDVFLGTPEEQKASIDHQ